MNADSWSVLHDGTIVAVSGATPGDLRLTVEIGYPCAHLPTRANTLIMDLHACEQFVYRPYDSPAVSDRHAIVEAEIEILAAAPDHGCLVVTCAARNSAGGELRVRCAGEQLTTAEGQPLSLEEVQLAARRYWAEWERRTRASPP